MASELAGQANDVMVLICNYLSSFTGLSCVNLGPVDLLVDHHDVCFTHEKILYFKHWWAETFRLL